MALSPAQRPERVRLDGAYVWLQPLDQRHAEGLFAISSTQEAADRYRWLPTLPPQSVDELSEWIEKSNSSDELYYAVIDKATGRVVGRQGFLRIRPEHASIEIGGIYWGLAMARSRLSTEAMFLFAKYAFDALGYRRFEWKCNDRNEPSKAAALRFGFQYEGLFRNDMIVKGESRDTAWFSIIDSEWASIRTEYERWLDPENFDERAQQRSKLDLRR